MTLSLKPLFRETTKADYLHAIKDATNWLDSQIIETEHGIYWQIDANGQPKLDVYSGSAGIVIYYLELAQVTGDDKYYEIVKRAADFIDYTVHQTDLHAYKDGIAGLKFPKAQWAMNTGHTGLASSLIEIAKATGVAKYADTAKYITEELIKAAEQTEDGIKWSGQYGILGDGGIILYLLQAAEYFNNEDWRDIAIKAGKYILSDAEHITDDVYRFHPIEDKYINPLWGLDVNDHHEWPNFEYGTSGTAFILARLYEVSNEQIFLEAAEKAINYLDSITTQIDEKAALVPYRLPDLNELFYLSYCHGPVGTTRAYQLLYKLTNKAAYLEKAASLARGIIRTAAPHTHSAGYWHFYSQCCGTAGFIELFLNIDQLTSDDEFADYAKASGEKILSEAIDTENGAYWAQAWTRTDPSHYTNDTGYFDGAAGIASGLLHLYTKLAGKHHKIYMADDVNVAKK